MNDRLREIVESKRKTLEARKREERRSLFKALSKKGSVNIIAELKKASPSAGIISRDFNPVSIAKRYTAGGAAALSVLTEEKYFKGDISYLKAAREVTKIPVLRKDFIFDPYQVYESAFIGADAILLIAALLDNRRLTSLMALADTLGLECLVEVHTEGELNRVLRTPARIIGINNRNLKDLSVDGGRALNLALKAPRGRLVVIESGIKTRKDMEPYLKKGIRAFLIGETLMRSKNITKTLKELRKNG